MTLLFCFLSIPEINKGKRFLMGNIPKSTLQIDLHSPHDPIFINGSDPARDWDNCDAVSGNGTFNNPYVIANLKIDSNGNDSCILIENTTAYFRVENCLLRYSLDTGIHLNQVGNGDLFNNYFENNVRGIQIEESAEINIAGNIIYGTSQNALVVRDSYNCTILANDITCTTNYALYLDTSHHCNVTENWILDSQNMGIQMKYSYNNSIVHNSIFAIESSGIDLIESSYNTLFENEMGGSYGIFSNTEYVGIHLHNAHQNLILGNYIWDVYGGIRLESGSGSNRIFQNRCFENFFGISLDYSGGQNYLNGNNVSNTQYGLYIRGGGQNDVIANNVTNSHYGFSVISQDNTFENNYLRANFLNFHHLSLTSNIFLYNDYLFDATVSFNTSTIFSSQSIKIQSYVKGGFYPYSYSWDFGDGTYSSSEDPIHQYNQNGTFAVNLTVTDQALKVMNFTYFITVNPKPQRPLSPLVLDVDKSFYSVTIKWMSPGDPNIKGFILYRSRQPIENITGMTPIASFGSWEGQYHDTKLKDGQYYYALTAVDFLGQESSFIDFEVKIFGTYLIILIILGAFSVTASTTYVIRRYSVRVKNLKKGKSNGYGDLSKHSGPLDKFKGVIFHFNQEGTLDEGSCEITGQLPDTESNQIISQIPFADEEEQELIGTLLTLSTNDSVILLKEIFNKIPSPEAWEQIETLIVQINEQESEKNWNEAIKLLEEVIKLMDYMGDQEFFINLKLHYDYLQAISRKNSIWDQNNLSGSSIPENIRLDPDQFRTSTYSNSPLGSCGICQKVLSEKEDYAICQDCFAKFHRTCLLRWLEQRKSCPVCQKEWTGWV